MSANVVVEKVLEGYFAPEQAGGYHHVPFEMPEGVCRLEVAYSYDHAIDSDPHLVGGNTVDIGLFDSRGVAYPGQGFRGWTGSARSELFITPAEATPGYLPGPLWPGIWHILLGFYKSAPQGCHYRVTLRFYFGMADEAQPVSPPLLTLDTAGTRLRQRLDGWYRGELHCHTLHSDGDSPPEALIAQAQGLGLDFLAITDHNAISHLVALAKLGPQDITIIPGCEVTTYKGHWNVWGVDEWIDFRTLTPELMRASIQRANDLGFLTSCNHPRPYGPPWEFTEVLNQHCIEVWNGPWEIFNHTALELWDAQLRAGRRMVAVGGSDAHNLQSNAVARIGTPTTWIYTPEVPTARALLEGLRAGHAFLSGSPAGPQLYLRAGRTLMGDTMGRPDSALLAVQVRVVGGNGLMLELCTADGCVVRQAVTADDQAFALEVPVAGTPYVRAQLVEPEKQPLTVHALTNPIYLE
ncbi:MAG: PHP domain-containing protein [Anaerolineae bacterium]|nr:PHP domain-containing protein [Anaerolineae bacterium]